MTTGSSVAPVAHASLGLRRHIVETGRLAAPLMVSRVGILILVAVDLAMTGRVGAAQLAYLGIGTAPQLVLMLVGLGMLRGASVLVSQAQGAGDYPACGRIWRVALVHAALLGAFFGVLCLFGEWFLLAIGQAADIAAGGGRVTVMYSWGLPAVLFGFATVNLLEGIGRPIPGMLAMIAGNLVNAALNWLFIYGHWGMPAMGAEGAVLATSLVRWLMLAMLVAYVLLMKVRRKYAVRGSFVGAWAGGRALRRLGFPIGLAQGMEAVSFQMLVLLSGYLGTVALAAYNIVNNVVSLGVLCAVGVSIATTVRVGMAVGRRDRTAARVAGWTGVALFSVLTVGFAVPLLWLPGQVAALYTSDPTVATIAISALAMAVPALSFSGIQNVLLGALRGLGDVWVPAWIQGLCLWVLMLPLVALFAFALDWGVLGLMAGLAAGNAVATILLTWRFAAISRRDIRRA